MNFNKVTIGGHITREIERKYTPDQVAVVSFGLAVNEKYKDKENVVFIDVTFFGKLGDVIAMYFKKGDPILIHGKLRLDRWQDKNDGSNRQKIHIIGETFSFCGGGKGAGSSAQKTQKPLQSTDDLDNEEVPF